MAGEKAALLADPVAEGRRVAEAAARADLPLRLLGGVAIAVRCPSSHRPPLERPYGDIDFATTGAAKDRVTQLMESLGYRGDKEFNMLHGHRRLRFWEEHNERQVDVFVNEANLCHRISLQARLDVVPLTLPLADLAILKLQVVETNEKDYLDLCAIFADHDLTADETGVNVTYIVNLAASDWGLWRTLGMVARRSEQFALELPGFAAGQTVVDRLRRLCEEMARAPKTRGWKLRSRIGDRKRWYELPEEVQ